MRLLLCFPKGSSHASTAHLHAAHMKARKDNSYSYHFPFVSFLSYNNFIVSLSSMNSLNQSTGTCYWWMPVITTECALHKYTWSTYSSSEPFQTHSPVLNWEVQKAPESFCEQGRDLQGGNRTQRTCAMCILIQMVCWCLKWKSWMFYWEAEANTYCVCLLSVHVLSVYNFSFYAQSQVCSSLSDAALITDNIATEAIFTEKPH